VILVLVAHVAHWHALEEMFSQDVPFLFRVEVTTGFFFISGFTKEPYEHISAAFLYFRLKSITSD